MHLVNHSTSTVEMAVNLHHLHPSTQTCVSIIVMSHLHLQVGCKRGAVLSGAVLSGADGHQFFGLN